MGSKLTQNITAGGGTVVLFLLQIVGASGAMNFLFFPAASLYLATYMTAPVALATGIIIGSIWDSVSLTPFGVYTFGLGGCMGGASLFMRLVDERNMAAHGFAACILWALYTLILGILYLSLKKGTHVLIFHGYDGLIGFLVLWMMIGGHFMLQKLYKHI